VVGLSSCSWPSAERGREQRWRCMALADWRRGTFGDKLDAVLVRSLAQVSARQEG
jgi:hypothetical protein